MIWDIELPFVTCDVKKNDTLRVNHESLSLIFAEGTEIPSGDHNVKLPNIFPSVLEVVVSELSQICSIECETC
jgi:hypothetical protein